MRYCTCALPLHGLMLEIWQRPVACLGMHRGSEAGMPRDPKRAGRDSLLVCACTGSPVRMVAMEKRGKESNSASSKTKLDSINRISMYRQLYMNGAAFQLIK